MYSLFIIQACVNAVSSLMISVQQDPLSSIDSQCQLTSILDVLAQRSVNSLVFTILRHVCMCCVSLFVLCASLGIKVPM